MCNPEKKETKIDIPNKMIFFLFSTNFNVGGPKKGENLVKMGFNILKVAEKVSV